MGCCNEMDWQGEDLTREHHSQCKGEVIQVGVPSESTPAKPVGIAFLGLGPSVLVDIPNYPRIRPDEAAQGCPSDSIALGKPAYDSRLGDLPIDLLSRGLIEHSKNSQFYKCNSCGWKGESGPVPDDYQALLNQIRDLQLERNQLKRDNDGLVALLKSQREWLENQLAIRDAEHERNGLTVRDHPAGLSIAQIQSERDQLKQDLNGVLAMLKNQKAYYEKQLSLARDERDQMERDNTVSWQC